MEFVKFKKVNREAHMPIDKENGCIYFVKDAKKIYADFDSNRYAFNISINDVNNQVTESVEDSLQEMKTALEAVEATLNPELAEEYEEITDKIAELGTYTKITDVQNMISAAQKSSTIKKISSTGQDGTIVINNDNTLYKIDTSERTDFNISTPELENGDVIEFELLVISSNGSSPNFLFTPITLDTGASLTYNKKYTLLDVKGIKLDNALTWTIAYRGSWN